MLPVVELAVVVGEDGKPLDGVTGAAAGRRGTAAQRLPGDCCNEEDQLVVVVVVTTAEGPRVSRGDVGGVMNVTGNAGERNGGD